MLNLIFFLFQSPVSVDNTTDVQSQSIVDIIISGGIIGIIIVAVLLILSFLALYIFIERFLTIGRAGKIDENFINNIRASVGAGNIEGAKALCRATDTPAARMIEKGLMRIGKPLKDIDAAIENVGNLEVFKLEKNLSSLASIAGAAPMVGFLGTVTGMILAFYNMSTQQNVTPSLLAGGIYQALITTAFGLVIGIFAFVGYNYLVAKVEKVIFQMEKATIDFMDLLQEPGH
ncbi:MAG: MotA/TolQ/ExbB proton channel family protein [Saprospiraceae bacterium]|jgi:biopolymer transport protein ExbB|nr:MotA/TolQ/ExbB proton channel family protein [Saprospiraceae bacterium]